MRKRPKQFSASLAIVLGIVCILILLFFKRSVQAATYLDIPVDNTTTVVSENSFENDVM